LTDSSTTVRTRNAPKSGKYIQSATDFRKALENMATSLSSNSRILEVSKWFLAKESMSNKKLQKLCYYAYAWYLVFFNDLESLESSSQLNTLCPTGFEAWVHGPVCPGIYHYYSEYGWNDIPSPERTPVLPSDVVDLLEQVWVAYGDLTADQLERLTHNEAPWREARKGLEAGEPSTEPLDEKLIIKFYSKMMGQ
jgi:uncharacterized phage-associated protein